MMPTLRHRLAAFALLAAAIGVVALLLAPVATLIAESGAGNAALRERLTALRAARRDLGALTRRLEALRADDDLTAAAVIAPDRATALARFEALVAALPGGSPNGPARSDRSGPLDALQIGWSGAMDAATFRQWLSTVDGARPVIAVDALSVRRTGEASDRLEVAATLRGFAVVSGPAQADPATARDRATPGGNE